MLARSSLPTISIGCRFVGFLPGCAIIAAIYLSTRRLAPLIIGHWIIDYCPICIRAARKGALET